MSITPPPTLDQPTGLKACAIAAAKRLADLYFPLTGPQREAQRAIYAACASGVERVKETMAWASQTSRGYPLATKSWKHSYRRWRLILKREGLV